MDTTEDFRRAEIGRIGAQVRSNDPASERARLEAQYGQVWDTGQMQKDFEALGFAAPYVVVKRKSDGKKGSLEFQASPRFYYDFTADA